jgi:limonene 1,2-monooxygenase
MMGIDPVVQRQRMAESLGAIMALLEARRPVDIETDWFTLRDARLQLASFTRPHLPVAVAASVTPSGPTLAGKHGIGLLSVAGANDESFTRTWQWVEEAAVTSGRTTNRGEWRVVVPVHLAHSKQEAIDDLREGYAQRAYIGDRKVPLPPETSGGVLLGSAGIASGTIEEAVENGAIIAGSVDDAVEAFERIQKRAGGLGGILCLAHEMASTEKTNRSYELLARYVAPHFQNQLGPIYESRDWVEDHQRLVFGQVGEAFAKAFDDAGKEIPAEVAPSIAMMRRRPRNEPQP